MKMRHLKNNAGNINEIVNDLLEEMNGLLKEGQQIHFINTIEGEVFIDKSLVKNILTNLFSKPF